MKSPENHELRLRKVFFGSKTLQTMRKAEKNQGLKPLGRTVVLFHGHELGFAEIDAVAVAPRSSARVAATSTVRRKDMKRI